MLRLDLQGTWTGLKAAWRREISAYFATPLAYVFVAIFLLVLGIFTWELSRFFDTGAADLEPFFYWHPWLFMLFMPALAMRLWSDESSQGTAELLLSLPVNLTGLVIGKLLAGQVSPGARPCVGAFNADVERRLAFDTRAGPKPVRDPLASDIDQPGKGFRI